MSALGYLLFEAVVKGAVVGLSSLLLVWVVAKRDSALRAKALPAVLAAMTFATYASLAPWPRRFSIEAAVPNAASSWTKAEPVPITHQTSSQSEHVKQTIRSYPFPRLTKARGGGVLDRSQEVQQLASAGASPAWQLDWRRPFLFVWTIGAAIGLWRFVHSLLAAWRLVRVGWPARDDRLTILVDQLSRELGVERRVEIRICEGLESPATLGRFRPVLLLPSSWASWSEDELRVVAAHELSHVKARDASAWLFAQFLLALNFVHPLAHWIVGRLRLDQELAADLSAAEHVGGRDRYLGVLARFALAAHSGPAAVQALTLFRTQSLLFRRIAMLRQEDWFASSVRAANRERSRIRARWGMLCGFIAFACLALVVTTVRGPLREAFSQEPTVLEKTGREANDDVAFDLGSYIPTDSAAVGVVRPGKLYNLSEVKSFLKAIGGGDGGEELNRIIDIVDPDSLDFVAGVMLKPPTLEGSQLDAVLMQSAGVIVRTTRPRDWKAYAALAGLVLRKVEDKDQTYYVAKTSSSNEEISFFMPNDLTIVAAYSPSLPRFIHALSDKAEVKGRSARFKALEKCQLGLSIDTAWVREAVLPLLERGGEGSEILAAASVVAPLWERTEQLTMTTTVGEKISLEISAVCKDEASAERVGKTLEAVFTLASNSAPKVKALIAKLGENNQIVATLTNAAEEALDNAKIEKTAGKVRLTTTTDKQILNLLLKELPGNL